MPIKLCLTGDYFLKNGSEFSFSEEFQNFWYGADYRIVNFEAPVVSGSVDSVKKAGLNLKHSEYAVRKLEEKRINLFHLANNHLMDYGLDGFHQTINTIGFDKCLGINFDNNEEMSLWNPPVLNNEGLSVALFGLSEAETGIENRPGLPSPILWVGNPNLKEALRKAKEKHDFVVVIIHAGIEDVPVPLPEWRAVYRQLCDWGADAIISHHPHIPQGSEHYRGSVIAYSLGNFFMDLENQTPAWNTGIVGLLTFKKNCQPIWEPRLISSSNGFIQFITDGKDQLEALDNLLLPENYQKVWDHWETWLWNNRYKYYAQDYVLGFSPEGGLASRLKTAIKGLLKKGTKARPELLYHNLHIESHRWFFERILQKQLNSI